MKNGFPMGDEFLVLVAEGEKGCEKVSEKSVDDLGEKAPKCRSLLGNVLSMLYREACCFYGCNGGDHLPQRIAGRVTSHALSAYRLLNRGYYDESLNLSRSIGEVANLLFLFALKPEQFESWKMADDHTRWRNFRPVKVREAIEDEGLPVPIDSDRYGLLSSVAAHIGPDVAPQAHLPQTRPTLGSYYRAESYLATLNELAAATGVASAGLVKLLPQVWKVQLRNEAVALTRSVGGVDLTAVRRMGG